MKRQSAVIDRIVDGKTAVLLLENEQRQLFIPVEKLPPGSKEGLWLLVELQEDELLKAAIDWDKTKEIKERISAKRAMLLRRSSRS